MKAGFALCLLALLPAPLLASVPPVLRYRTADGLPTNQVTHLLHDHLGFLWVGTGDGLARFDGDRFETFGTKDGLLATNKQLHDTMTKLRIPHGYEEYDGDHTNKVRERVERNLLPFFSKNLASPVNPTSPTPQQ